MLQQQLVSKMAEPRQPQIVEVLMPAGGRQVVEQRTIGLGPADILRSGGVPIRRLPRAD